MLRLATVVLAVFAVGLAGQAVITATLPQPVLYEITRARVKVERDNALADSDFRGFGRRSYKELSADEKAEALKWMQLPTDEQIDGQMADPAVASRLLKANRDKLRDLANVKVVGASALFVLVILVVLKYVTAARVLAWVLAGFGVVATVGLIAGLSDMRAADRYYSNLPLRMVDFIALGTAPLGALACIVVARTLASARHNLHREPHDDVEQDHTESDGSSND